MKNHFFYFLLLCVILAAACKDDDAKPADCPIQFSSSINMLTSPATRKKHPCDYITASKNGAQWAVHATSSFGFENDTLYVYGSGNEETLVLKLLFAGPGTYELEPKADDQYLKGDAYYYRTLGGDVIISQYVLAEKAVVEIAEYNEREKVIKGNFEFHFTQYSGSSTLDFKEGTFSVHLPH